MAKETYIRLRCTEEFKEQVDQAATQENRTISNYMENLLITDMKKKGIVKDMETENLKVMNIKGLGNVIVPEHTKESDIIWVEIPKENKE